MLRCEVMFVMGRGGGGDSGDWEWMDKYVGVVFLKYIKLVGTWGYRWVNVVLAFFDYRARDPV